MSFNINLSSSLVQGLSSNSPCFVLYHDLLSGKSHCMQAVIQRIMRHQYYLSDKFSIPSHRKSLKRDEVLFINPVKALDKAKENFKDKSLNFNNPRGAIVLSSKLEFATNYYTICRSKMNLRYTRLGTSLQTMSPNVVNKIETDEEKTFKGNANLLAISKWRNIDILFTTPELLKFILTEKEKYDPYDINPEILFIDDFDYLMHNPTMRIILQRLLVKNRKTIFFSSIAPYDDNIKVIEREIKNTHQVLKDVTAGNEFYNDTDNVIIEKTNNSSFPQIQRAKYNFADPPKILENKARTLVNLIRDLKDGEQMIISSNAKNIPYIKNYLSKKKIIFTVIDDNDRVSHRLYSMMLYNKCHYPVLLSSSDFLRSLAIVNASKLIVFDRTEDERDMLRMISLHRSRLKECHVFEN